MKDLQGHPYFWLDSKLGEFAKSRVKLVYLSCQVMYSILDLFSYFFFVILVCLFLYSYIYIDLRMAPRKRIYSDTYFELND